MKDGGPAFPFQVVSMGGTHHIYPGMTLRDYFAAQAMEGFIAGMHAHIEPGEHCCGIARDCYAIADAMLAERAK